MRIYPFRLSWCPLFLGMMMLALSATGRGQVSNQGKKEFANVWTAVEPLLGDPASVRPYTFIDKRVREVCHGESSCRYAVYDKLVGRLEEIFHLPAAVYAAEQRLNLARFLSAGNDLSKDYADLYRFHHALGNYEIAVINLENAIAAARRAGNSRSLNYLMLYKLEDNLEYLKTDVAFSALDSFSYSDRLLADTPTLLLAHQRMISIAAEHGHPTKVAAHLEMLETLLAAQLPHPPDLVHHMVMAYGRGHLAGIAGHQDSAIAHYQNARQFAHQIPDNWWEIKLLNRLACQESLMGQEDRAWAYLDTAITQATSLGLVEMLAKAYETAAALAERQQDYRGALQYQKLYQEEVAETHQRAAGFSTRNYYLRQEKEALETARDTQQAQLRIQEVYSRTLLVSVVVISALAMGLILAYRNQRRRGQELVQRNALISKQAKQLEELDQVKNTFFANVSHELRTPLTLIVGPLSTLQRDPTLKGRQRQLLDLISSSGRRLETLVTDLLRLSELERDQTELRLESTELPPFFQEPFDQFTALATTRQLHFLPEIDLAEGTRGEIDREKCRRIIFNLLSNAFRHTPSGGVIRARVSLAAGRLGLTIEDSGSGIHPDDLPYIFDRYWQSSRTEKTAGGGLGIGLSLCQHYVRMFGGEIEVDSTPGKGTSFRVNFPLQVREAVSTPSPTVLPDPTPDSSIPVILIAEDNTDVGAYLRMILSDTYTVIIKQNGREALDYLRSAPGRVDLLLTDLMMPVMDGFALLEAIKSDPALGDIPVVVVTARSGEADKHRVLRLGIDDYLVKPFSQAELQARIRDRLKNRRVRVTQPQLEEEAVHDERDAAWLKEFEAYVSAHCGDPSLSVLHLSREFAMSESTLLRRLKSLIGLTPQKYVQEVRLERARRRLERRDYDTLEQLAQERRLPQRPQSLPQFSTTLRPDPEQLSAGLNSVSRRLCRILPPQSGHLAGSRHQHAGFSK